MVARFPGGQPQFPGDVSMSLIPVPLQEQAHLGIAGHIGVGHACSHQGFVQDDAAGFAALVALLSRLCSMDMTVDRIRMDEGRLGIRLLCGGEGTAALNTGCSLSEWDVLQRAEGMCEFSSQTLATRVLGRVRGQGVDRLAAVLTLAHARAMLDAVRRHWPEATLHAQDDVPGSCGEFLGGKLRLGQAVCGWLLTINASPDGTGPVEDSEGIVPTGSKGRLLRELGLLRAPVIVLESRAFCPGVSDDLAVGAPWIRWNNQHDNPVVGECLAQAAQGLGLNAVVCATAYARREGEMAQAVRAIGQKICRLGARYARAQTSAEKVSLAAELADILAHDLGGTTFMSNGLHALVAGGGLWPGQAAVLSLLTSRREYEAAGEVVTNRQELFLMADIVLAAIPLLFGRLAEARACIEERTPEASPDQLLVLSGAC